MNYRIAVILALLAQVPSSAPGRVYWECNGVVRETTVEEMAKIGCSSAVFTIADGGDSNPQATPYGQKTPKALPTPPPSGMALKWDESVGLLANNASADVSVWSVNCKDAKVCNAFKAVEFGRTLFVIADGDGPAGVGGPCDLGKLVRAVKWDLETNHGTALVIDNAQSRQIFIAPDGAKIYQDNSPCASLPPQDYDVCRAEENLKHAKEDRARRAEWDKKWMDLRAELSRCEPKKPEPR